jgi:hypothetical protein
MLRESSARGETRIDPAVKPSEIKAAVSAGELKALAEGGI